MIVKKAIFYPVLILILLALTFIFLNYDYFIYLADETKPFENKYSYISNFIGGDSRFYYSIPSTTLRDIYHGLLAGSVQFGSIFSLVGIYFYVESLKILFVNEIFGVFLGNMFLNLMILRSLEFENHRQALAVVFCFPLTLNYVLVPNKEIFGLFLLAILCVKNSRKTLFSPYIISIIRESYLVQFIFHYSASLFGYVFMYLIYFMVIPFTLSEGYFENYHMLSRQRSGEITMTLNYFLQIPFLSVIGVLGKIILGMFSPLALVTSDTISIIKLQYFGCSLINLMFISKMALSKSFRTKLFRFDAKFMHVCFVYGSVMALAPGNPARFLAPLSFMFLYKLLTWKNK